jgi:hypothetical protein
MADLTASNPAFLPVGSDALPDVLYTWSFLASSGDAYGGVALYDAGRFAVGDYWFTPHGRFAIDGVAVTYGRDLSAEGYWEGLVWTDWYYDAALGGYLEVYSDLGYPTSHFGLGAERDYAWNGLRWDLFGYGGGNQATLFA